MSLHAYLQGLDSNSFGLPADALTPDFYRRLEEKIYLDPDYGRNRSQSLTSEELLAYKNRIRQYAQETPRG
jgi:hypothetical protein